MKRVNQLLALLLLTLPLSGIAQEIEIHDPYARAVPPGQPNSAVFMRMVNSGSEPRALVRATSSAAEVVELHTHTLEGGMMRMREIARIELPAGEEVRLEPGGLHIMLIGLAPGFAPDSEVELTLHFADGSEQTLTAPVRRLQMEMQGHHHH